MSDTPSEPTFLEKLLAWLALVALALVAFGPSLGGGRLWDDPAHLTRHDLQTWGGLVRIWGDLGATQQYYPVLHSAFWLEHRLWGDSLVWYHATNIVQHATAAWLLGRFLQVFSRWRRAGWAAAAIFAVHPVAVESVAWITEQKNTLSLLLSLGAGLAWARYVSNRSLRNYLAGAFLFLLALGTKSVTATLPAALLVALWWRDGRLSWREAWRPLLPWLLVGAGAGLFTAWVERTYIGAQGEAFALGLPERCLLASRALWFYLGQWAWPADLAFFYRLWDVTAEAGGWWGYLAGVALAAGGLVYISRWSRGPLSAGLIYAGTLFPALGFLNVFPFQFSYVADHFQYHAMTALAAGLAGLGAWLLRGVGGRRGPTSAVLTPALLAVAVCLYLSRGYSARYVDNETLFRANLESVPDNWMAHRILAVELGRQPGREQEAERHFREALRLRPGSPDVHMGLAEVLARTVHGREEAVALYRRAVELRPHFVEARYNLGLLLAADPRSEAEARQHLEAAIASGPSMLEARLALARLLARRTETRMQAVPVMREALRLFPDSGEAHQLQAGLEMAQGRRVEALRHFEQAVTSPSARAEWHFEFAQALAQDPAAWRQAVTQLQHGLHLQPESADARNMIGILFAQNGDLATARQWWEEAQRVRPGHGPSLENLRRLGAR